MDFSTALAHGLRANGTTKVFCVTGGYAQYLNRAFGEHLDVTYTQTEQTAGYAAMAYTKLTGIPSVVCVTAGCGATNAVTPLNDAFQDSIPLFFVSGQVNTNEVAKTAGRRHYMGAWADITRIVGPISKAVAEPLSAAEAASAAQTLWATMTEGRPGPVWLSMPLDVQRAQLDGPLALPCWSVAAASEYAVRHSDVWLNLAVTAFGEAERPVILIGGGAAHVDGLRQTLEAWGAPCVFTFMGLDVLPSDHPLYCGRVGAVGDRSGNMTMQNADLIIALGCRLAGMVVGYDVDTFAREATVVSVNTDAKELEHLPRNRDFGVCCDVTTFALAAEAVRAPDAWRDRATSWKTKWFRQAPAALAAPGGPYDAMEWLNASDDAPATTYIHASGSTFNIIWHMLRIREGDHFVCSSQGDMGFELPAAVGAVIGGAPRVMAFMGDGSFCFNIQDLQTLRRVATDATVTLVVLDNDGLQSIVLSQQAAFKKTYGTDSASGFDLPDLAKVCAAFDVSYVRTTALEPVPLPHAPGVTVLHVVCEPQQRCPKLHVTYQGLTPIALPLEDMGPLLPWDEFASEMQITPIPRN